MKAARISRNIIDFSAISMCRVTPPTHITFLLLLKPEQLVFPLFFHSIDSGDERGGDWPCSPFWRFLVSQPLLCLWGGVDHPLPSLSLSFLCPRALLKEHCCDEIHLVLSEGLARIMLKNIPSPTSPILFLFSKMSQP